MGTDLRGDVIGSQALKSMGGADAKRFFKIDTTKFSWVDDYLRDEALRKKIKNLKDNIRKAQHSNIHKDELRAMFDSAIAEVREARLSWFEKKLKAVQERTGAIINSYMLAGTGYTSPIGLSEKDIDEIFSRLPEGIKQADINADVKRMNAEIAEIEAVIAKELSPRSRWIYREDGEPHPYPLGCRWTQYVIAWKKVAPRFDGPVSMEGLSVENESEKEAYFALGLDKLRKVYPLRNPVQG